MYLKAAFYKPLFSVFRIDPNKFKICKMIDKAKLFSSLAKLKIA